MKICAYVDFMGTTLHTPEEEYIFMKKAIMGFLDISEENLIFVKNVYPYELRNNPCDLYIFDYGGVMPGCYDTVFSHYRELVRQIQDKPNTLFLIWSAFSARNYYVDAVKEEMREAYKNSGGLGFGHEFPNVIIRDIDNSWVEDMYIWFKLKER